MSEIFSLEAPSDLLSGLLKVLPECGLGEMEVRRFPDGESYVRVITPCQGQRCVIVCSLRDPDARIPSLLFAARTMKDMGAEQVGLLAPYLAYMRQDIAFRSGEAVTAAYFAQWISAHFDWLVTVDPHLHRIHDLAEVYSIPTTVVRAAPVFAKWIQATVDQPLLIGPDEESAQWAADVAERVGAPHLVLKKVRAGDREVSISKPDVSRFGQNTPVLVDDIISTGRTMAETVSHLVGAGLKPPICMGIHGVLAPGAVQDLLDAGAARVVTSNTVDNEIAGIDLSCALGDTLRSRLLA